MSRFLTAILFMLFANPMVAQQGLPSIDEQEFKLYQSDENGITVLIPTLGFYPLDQQPSDDDHDFLDSATSTISLSFWPTEVSGSQAEALAELRTELSAGDRVITAEYADHNGVVFDWRGPTVSSMIKITFLAGCDHAALLTLTFPNSERAQMESYFSVLAMGFNLGPSQSCPAP